jgi:hypothetical protein
MDSVTMNKKFETDETKFFLDVHGACTLHPQDLDGLYFFTSPLSKEFLLKLNLTQHQSALAPKFQVNAS